MQNYTIAAIITSSLLLSACGSSGYPNTFDIPSNISTDRSTKFKLGSIFIDARNTNHAFLTIHKVEGGAVGEQLMASALPVGRTDELTVTLEGDEKLSPGLQQLQITAYLDDPENPNGTFDATDPIAKAGKDPIQVTVTVDYTPSNTSYVDFVTETETDSPREFDLGMIQIMEEDTSAKNVLIAAYRDDNGARGDLLAVREVSTNTERKVSISMDPPTRLIAGEQKVHVVVYFEEIKNGELDDDDPVGEIDGKDLEFEITVNLTNDSYNPTFTLVDSLTVTTPSEFEVGSATFPTEGGTRYWMVTRLMEGGAPGTVLGVNEQQISFDERTLKVKLDHQLMVEDQTIHVGIYPSRSGLGWTVENFDPSSPVLTNDSGDEFQGTIDVEFISTVEDPDAEFYAYTCGDKENAERNLMYKTDLPVDCRCALNRVTQPTYEKCNAMAAQENGYTLGEGPRFEQLQGHMTSGDIFPERSEIIFGIDRGGVPRRKFTIVALNYETNTRRFVSGEVKDPFSGEFVMGEGPLGGEVSYIRRGPNGEVFVMTANDGGQILRIDPDTGDRELLWQHDDEAYGQCPNGVPALDDPVRRLGDSQPAPYQTNIEGRGFTIDPRDGSFYFATRNNGVPAPGYGLVKISPEGDECSVVTTSQAEERNLYHGGIGQGYELKSDIKSMLWHEGKLLAIAGSDLLEIDPDTGNRVRIAGGTITGSSGVPPVYRMFWNPDQELLMLTGVLPPNNPNIVAVDLETREVWGFKCLNAEEDSPVVSCMRGPQETLYIAYWPSYMLPDGSFLGGIFRYGFTRYELFQGNSYLFNY